MDSLTNNFHQTGYCLLDSVISNELQNFIAQYALFDEIQDFRPNIDIQVPEAHAKYGDPAMESLLLHIQPVIERASGFQLYPTYSYFRVYRAGDILEKHTDRESCEISISVCFNYSYDSSTYQWPIYINNDPIVIQPGGGVMYKGCDVEHWREKFAPPSNDDWQVQGFFHYVNAKGPYANFKYDNRTSIGQLREPKNKNIKKPYITFLK